MFGFGNNCEVGLELGLATIIMVQRFLKKHWKVELNHYENSCM
jgi:hypothetical protein